MWEQELDMEFTDEQWSKWLLEVGKLTNSVKLRDFQYRIMNRCLTLNVHRAKYTKMSSKWTFCADHDETTRHIFWDCKYSKQLWKALIKWLNNLAQQKVKLQYAEIILNQYKGANRILINTLILIMKRYIYVAKCKEDNNLNFISFVALVRHTQNVEEINAHWKDKQKIHLKKWPL